MPPNAKRRPGRGDGAAAEFISDAIELSRPSDPVQALAPLRCAGCGVAGTEPRVIWDRSAPEAQVPVLVPCFGWHADGKPALLCGTCKRQLAKRRGRARYSKPRPTDGHLL